MDLPFIYPHPPKLPTPGKEVSNWTQINTGACACPLYAVESECFYCLLNSTCLWGFRGEDLPRRQNPPLGAKTCFILLIEVNKESALLAKGKALSSQPLQVSSLWQAVEALWFHSTEEAGYRQLCLTGHNLTHVHLGLEVPVDVIVSVFSTTAHSHTLYIVSEDTDGETRYYISRVTATLPLSCMGFHYETQDHSRLQGWLQKYVLLNLTVSDT